MNKTRFIHLFIISILCACATWLCPARAQSVGRSLSFTVRDAGRGTALGNVVCKVYTAGGKFHAYAISDGAGRLRITVGKGDMLEFSYVGYGALKARADAYAEGRDNVVELREGDTVLREVTIKARPVTAHGDTLAYNVASFVKPGDVHLEDVLRKMPGIKVADNGAVSYQGKAINKFYIEGKDLLGSSYGQATRNMPVGAVATVEVLENHQPVKMLRGRQFSDKAALNIKLEKSHRARPFGEAEGGLGGSPTVWNNSLFLTQILGKSQLMLTAKMNNSGEDISGDTREYIDISDLDAYEPLPSRLLSTETGPEALPLSRYVRNKSYSAGLNYLTNVSADATLRLNVLAYEDHSSAASDYRYTYGGTRTVSISELNRQRMQTLTVMPIMRYELNGDNVYLSDELRYSFSRSAMDNVLTANGTGIAERTYSRPAYVRNYLAASVPAGNLIVQARSLLRYYDRNEALDDAADSARLYNVAERYSTRAFTARNSVTTSIPLWGNNLDVGFRAYYVGTQYGYSGRVRNGKLRIGFTPRYVMQFGNDRVLSVGMPVEWLDVSNSLPAGDGHGRSCLALSPSADLNYRIDDKWRFGLSASMDVDNMTGNFFSAYALRTSYRTVYVPGTDVYLSRSYRLSARLNYRNLATMFFWNASVAYSDERLDGFTDYDYTDSLTVITLTAGANHRRNLMADIGADKSFTDAGLTLKAGLEYEVSSYLLSQSGIRTMNRSHVMSANLNAVWQKLKWLRLTLGVTGTLCWERNDVERADALSSLTGNASVFLFPLKGLGIKLRYYNYTNELSPSHYKSAGLLDADISYEINKTWKVGCSLANMLNAREYTIMQTSGVNTSRYSIPLRGREVLFKVGLRI